PGETRVNLNRRMKRPCGVVSVRELGVAAWNMPSILVNTHSFHYEEMGHHGEPLVFLSGLGGDHRAFGLAQRHFGPRYRTLAFDARDVSRRDRFSESYTTADMAGDV